ncbi:MAG: multidrug efflux SMR transporter [Gemmatimonadaceae bacterium]|nr:multidrug efflux SMR transporter [Gemmatimonadaceae bacterium]
MAWIYLGIAGLLEIVFAYGLKTAEGFTRLWPSVLTVLAAAASLYMLSLSMRTIPIGTGYAVWTGIGAAGTALVGIIVLGEPRTAPRVASLALILIGVIGLRVFSD